ncbi:molybdopterin-dependent oxidoreductase [Pseudoflavonifractor sp. MSJ-37]|uniref:molybdopterin-containing oxidoreductase family protein n=1 Tax=Pseudoflavonifractor sp. MSJ-37 TaxID=2841531 RepID=UPI001C0F7B99|nr:molybdopterin-dependent oxidoreductase [Pseudoflavonifractor sp. MSJ-37]MBU5435461.1 molybdopterin-dependent oxidoreductase [Pseudoflavonifractor sp. MSJ-37]
MGEPERRKTVCEICLNNCGVDAWVQDGKVVKVEGSPECPDRGRLCVKGYASRDYIYRADRIKTPLRRVGRRGEGKFEPISWDEAYTEIARKLNGYKKEFGADSVAFYTGYSKWYRTMFHRFVHSFGTRNYGTESSSCFQAMRMANILTGGSLSRPDIAHAELFLAWAYDPFYSSVFHYDMIEKQREKGMKVICIDPKVTPFSQLADIHLRPRAGTDGALALYFGQYLIAHGAVDQAYIDAHVHGYPEYAAYVKEFSAERTAQLTGIPVDQLEAAGALLTEDRRFAISLGAAPLTHHRNGVQNIRALLALSAISGSYDREGGNIPTEFANPKMNADCDVGDERFIDEVRPEGGRPKIGTDRFPVWSELIDEFQAMDLSRQILEGTPYPIQAVFSLGMNARMFPGDGKLFQALSQVGFFVDVDIFLTDTAKYADIVLPACTSFERAQFQGGFMGHYFNTPTVRWLDPVIEPLYESKSDADILCELANYLELDDPILRKGYEACSRYLLRRVGVTFSELQTTHATTRIPGKEPYRPGDNTAHGYATPTGKFELTSEVLRRHGFDPLPTYRPSADEHDPEEYPLQLTAGGRLPYHFHSRFQNSALKKVFRPESMADISPEDAKALRIRQGDAIALTTAYGTIRLKANVTHTVAPGAVFVYQDYPDADVNSIIGPEHLDPISGFPGYRSVRCRVEKVKPQKETERRDA